MQKAAQYADRSILTADPAIRGRSLADLYYAVRADQSLQQQQKQLLLLQIQQLSNGAPPSTPLSSLMLRGLGGIVGVLISRYFGLGAVGQLVDAVSGVGIGGALYRKLNAPQDALGRAGYRSI